MAGSPPIRPPFVSDADCETALLLLRDQAPVVGRARGALIRAEHMIKVVRSQGVLRSTQRNAQLREADALTSEQYLAAVEAHVAAATDFEVCIAERKGAEMTIEAWRSLNANMRGMKV